MARLHADLQPGRLRRHTAATDIITVASKAVSPAERPSKDDVQAHVAIALDAWLGHEFTDRNRSRSWSWMPFVDGELDPTPDTDETRRARLERDYRLSGEEYDAVAAMRNDFVGVIALAAGHIAASIHAYPAWKLDFFDDHHVRVDLPSEVSAIAKSAITLRDNLRVLGPSPTGHLVTDTDVVNTYIHKARALDRSADGLMERLTAFNSYREIVASIQRRHEKRQWMERVGSIDDFEIAVDDDFGRREGARLRDAASESHLYATVYLESLAPLTATLNLSPTRN